MRDVQISHSSAQPGAGGWPPPTPADQIAWLRELLQCNAQLTGARRERAFGPPGT